MDKIPLNNTEMLEIYPLENHIKHQAWLAMSHLLVPKLKLGYTYNDTHMIILYIILALK